MNIKLQLFFQGWKNLRLVIYAWRKLLQNKQSLNKFFFSRLDCKPTLEDVSLKYRKDWVIVEYLSYFTLYECPKTGAFWLEYPEGWGSPARYVHPNENLMDVVREMECCQY